MGSYDWKKICEKIRLGFIKWFIFVSYIDHYISQSLKSFSFETFLKLSDDDDDRITQTQNNLVILVKLHDMNSKLLVFKNFFERSDDDDLIIKLEII